MSHSGYAELLIFQCKAARLPAPTPELVFAKPRKWRFDLAWESHKLAAEVEGGTFISGRHSRGVGFERDCEKYGEAIVRGWRVLRVTSRMVKDGRALDLVERAINGDRQIKP